VNHEEVSLRFCPSRVCELDPSFMTSGPINGLLLPPKQSTPSQLHCQLKSVFPQITYSLGSKSPGRAEIWRSGVNSISGCPSSNHTFTLFPFVQASPPNTPHFLPESFAARVHWCSCEKKPSGRITHNFAIAIIGVKWSFPLTPPILLWRDETLAGHSPLALWGLHHFK
jgi:hypothetical protein